MITLRVGKTFENNEHGTVEVMDIQESLSEAYFTDKGEEVVFEGGSVNETYIRFYSKLHGQEGSQEVMEFCEDVGLF
jgi:hypothetical protein